MFGNDFQKYVITVMDTNDTFVFDGSGTREFKRTTQWKYNKWLIKIIEFRSHLE